MRAVQEYEAIPSGKKQQQSVRCVESFRSSTPHSGFELEAGVPDSKKRGAFLDYGLDYFLFALFSCREVTRA